MPAFKDANGKEWLVKLDAPTIADVRKELGIDLVDLEGKAVIRLESDPVLLVDVLWIVCRDQAKQITSRQFGEALVGDPIESATKALLDALLDFFPKGKRDRLRSLMDMMADVKAKGEALAMAKLGSPELTTTLLKAAETEMDRKLTEILTRLSSAIDSQAVSASVPAA